MSVEKGSSLATDPTDIWNASNLPEGFTVQQKHGISSTPHIFDTVEIITHKSIFPFQLVPNYGLGHYLKIAMSLPSCE
jgi:hypothetical protein